MNKHVAEFRPPEVTTGALPGSRRVYSQPDAAPDLRVPLREIQLSEAAAEPPLPVYDAPTRVFMDCQSMVGGDQDGAIPP